MSNLKQYSLIIYDDQDFLRDKDGKPVIVSAINIHDGIGLLIDGNIQDYIGKKIDCFCWQDNESKFGYEYFEIKE